MKRRTVVDPVGRAWVVALRWLPWAPRWRGPRLSRQESTSTVSEGQDRSSRWDWLDFADPLMMLDEGCLPVLGYLLGIALVASVILFALPVFVFVIEILLVVLVVVIGLILRVVFRRPWLIDAVSRVDGSAKELVWAVVGYRRSREVVDEIARQLEAGAGVPVVPDATLVGSRSLS